ncbi:hypothetical protein N7462_007494 [Penicillium macrosclerotiorum]|uniref:uncharacterized protein n=1 Tax=Penicillium macrosclerotiorum TaxID=303699 RepID=UPI002548C8C9|nr:uncharacterized protein N7462_007494 [Penicillium macrosclerotiorum]KAJ5679250.1 hypothetical protein N7462_007494 [Penicillium macrosclerotiorum]
MQGAAAPDLGTTAHPKRLAGTGSRALGCVGRSSDFQSSATIGGAMGPTVAGVWGGGGPEKRRFDEVYGPAVLDGKEGQNLLNFPEPRAGLRAGQSASALNDGGDTGSEPRVVGPRRCTRVCTRRPGTPFSLGLHPTSISVLPVDEKLHGRSQEGIQDFIPRKGGRPANERDGPACPACLLQTDDA